MCVCVKKSAGKVITNLPLKTTGTFCFKWQHKQQKISLITNVPFHGFRRHLDLGANKTWLLCNAPYISFQNKTQFATLEQVLAFFWWWWANPYFYSQNFLSTKDRHYYRWVIDCLGYIHFILWVKHERDLRPLWSSRALKKQYFLGFILAILARFSSFISLLMNLCIAWKSSESFLFKSLCGTRMSWGQVSAIGSHVCPTSTNYLSFNFRGSR